MISEEEAKSKIKRLIDLYEKYQSTGQIDNFRGKEDNTKSTFIEPFFEALGWNIKNQEGIEMLKEEPILKGAVDYAFLIEGQYKFFVEAKPIGRDLKNVKSLKEAAEQSIRYGVNSNNKYVVLTNFEWLVIFNCELKGQLWEKWLFEPMSYKDYLANFKQIWPLSKEGALKNELDALAGKVGKRVPRTPVDKELLQKFLKWREKLSKDLKKYPEEEIDEFVQKLLIRLLFIRNCEDRGFETIHTLWSASQFYRIHKRGLLKFLRGIFKYYDIYNGSIFKESEIDSIEFNESLLAEIINGLYVSEDEVKYDFNIIPADVMGNLYEQYLGHILKKTPQTAKLKEGKAHRKEQGIYYTPTYIVDYIVKNTLGELLKNKKVDTSKIRVLDPACGSGSFLVKAFDVLNEHYAKDKMYGQKTLTGYSTKERILKDNIFGVDLDKQAAEIAQLNLLLRIAEKGQKLPLLKQNVKIGNSLIDDEKVAGDKAFKWEEQFKDIVKDGGFDIVIGNPPYIQLSMEESLTEAHKSYLINRFKSSMGRLNTFGFFIKLGIDLLKKNGRLGFIVPNTILTQEYYKELREMILNICKIESIVNFSDLPFKDATVENVILILQKMEDEKERRANNISILGINDKFQFVEQKKIIQDNFLGNENKSFNIFLDEKTSKLKKKIEENTKPLFNFLEINQAIALKHDREKYLDTQKKDKDYHKVIDGRNINRYSLKWGGDYLKYDIKAIHSCKREDIFLTNEKLFFRRVGRGLIATLDNEKLYALNTLVVMNKKSAIDLDLRYLLAIFNSKLMDYYYRTYLKSTKTVFSEIQARQIKKLPVKQIPESQQKPFIKLVDKMLSLNKHLNEIGDKKTDARAKLEEEIKKIDTEIDELVYKIYGITEKEKKIIEESLK